MLCAARAALPAPARPPSTRATHARSRALPYRIPPPAGAQVVLAYCGAVFGLITLVKATRSGAVAAVEDAPVAAVVATDGAIPSIDSPDFDAWASQPGNEEKWCASFE